MILLLAALFSAPALAQQPVDVGVVRESHAIVVQKLLYPKAHSTELVASVGIMGFNPYTWTPNAQVGLDHHLSETLAIGAVIGVGYGLPTPSYTELVVDYGIAPYAFRYLGSFLAGVTWSPVYAKASLDGSRIVHFDIYGAGRLGVTLEQSVIPGGGMPAAPTISPAIGARVFIKKSHTVRLELRDDLMFQWRTLTSSLRVKQNVAILAGFTWTMARGEKAK